MTYRIETRNHYLRFAIDVLFRQHHHVQDSCIIDLSSYHSLQAIMQCIMRNSDVNRFIFLGNDGMNSRSLQSLISVEGNAPLKCCHEQIILGSGVSYHMAIEQLIDHRSMDNYSYGDKIIVYSLLLRDSMSDAARFIGVSDRQFYSKVDRLKKKLNLRSRLQVQLFFRYEFHPEYVLAKIKGPLPTALLRHLRSVN